jgi:hypothetical protein
MINIILKNKTLIKLYKYSVTTFKFMNKHLYLLSIISFISRSRKSVYYKIVTLIIKIVLIINLIITSGLFFTVVDLYTPFNTIESFYSDLLGPYIEILKLKYNDLNNIYTSEKSIQTDLTCYTLRNLFDYIDHNLNNRTDSGVQTSNLLNSTQLLDDNNIK